MKTIFKYPLEITDRQILSIPEGAEILCVQNQNNKVYLWAMIEMSNPNNIRKLRIIGTGHDIENEKLNYIGTIQQMEGQLVWHIFEALT